MESTAAAALGAKFQTYQGLELAPLRRSPVADCLVLAMPDVDTATIAADSSKAFAETLGVPLDPDIARAHRWRLSRPVESLEIGCIWDDALRLAARGSR